MAWLTLVPAVFVLAVVVACALGKAAKRGDEALARAFEHDHAGWRNRP